MLVDLRNSDRCKIGSVLLAEADSSIGTSHSNHRHLHVQTLGGADYGFSQASNCCA